jgi:hypothetical protein
MSWSYTYDTNTPANTDDPQEADDRMREIKAATQERLNVTLYFPLTGTEVSDDDAGEVRKIPFHEPISTPTAVADKAFLYAKDSDDSYIELYFLDEQSNEIQITDQGYLVLANGRLANNTFLKAINAAGDGTVDLIKADASDVTVINDGTQTETNAAPSDDKGLANKKYVDDSIESIVFQAPVTVDDNSDTLVVNTIYQAKTDGFINYRSLTQSQSGVREVRAYVGATNPPTTEIDYWGANTGQVISAKLAFPVKKDYYWKITKNGTISSERIVWTPMKNGTANPEIQ